MIHDRLKIFFRQMQLRYDVDGDGNEENVVAIYDDATRLAKYVAGNVPVSAWQDMTEFTEGLDKLSLAWDKANQAGTSSETNAGGSNYDKGISATLTFDTDAFNFIYDWLLDESYQILNAIEVKITDAICKKDFRLFEIKADNVQYAPDDECRLEVTLREQDLTWHAIHKTFIWDDWQKWFNSDGTSTKAHPTFRTCIEPRPRIISSVRMALALLIQSNPAVALINFISGDNIQDDARRILEFNKFQPAPLIRDIITNFCDHYGFAYDTIFTDPALPYYNACLYFPSAGAFYEDNTGGNTQNVYLFDNRWNITVAELLDKLRTAYQSEWYITPNSTLVFKPTKDLINLQPIYDFTAANALPIDVLRYTFNGDKKPAYGRYEYQPDGSDLASQEIRTLYNDIVDYDGPALNPMLEGSRNKSLEFAATGFYRDGRCRDYVSQIVDEAVIGAKILIAILAFIALMLSISAFAYWIAGSGPIATAAFIAIGLAAWSLIIEEKGGNIKEHLSEPLDNRGMVRLTSEQTMMPRLLLWDGQDINTAKVVQTQSPPPNLYYNPAGTPYPDVNKNGIDNDERFIYNYPLYFDSMFTGNLYDRFHDDIDNPLKSLENNQTFEFSTDLCCEAMDLFGCWQGSFVRIGYLIKIEDRPKYEVYGRIEHIDVKYDDFTIFIKGKVIKKKK